MKKLFIYTTLLFSLGVQSLKAQMAQQKELPSSWTLEDCIDYAKENNISISSLKLNQQSTEQDLVLSKAAKLPSLSANASQSLLVNNKGLNPSSGYGLSSDITIYTSGYLNNDIAQKQLSVKSAALNVLQQQNDITLQITQAI